MIREFIIKSKINCSQIRISTMTTKESQQTKQTLNENKDKFKKLQASVNDIRSQVKKKILKEINQLQKQQQKEAMKQRSRKKALAMKGQIRQNYSEDDSFAQEVPVDGQLKSGTMVFMKNCAHCHSLEGVDPKPMKGPSLGVIYNRRVGSNPNYDYYTDSMLKSTFFWSPLNLYRFMADARSLVPKTSCFLAKKALTSQSDRADLITMFRQFTPEVSFNMRLKQIERIGYTAFQSDLRAEEEMRKRGMDRDKQEKAKNKKI